MKSAQDLRSLLLSIDHRGYPAYKDTKGSYRFPDYILHIDHVQGDPFASPSNLSIEVPGAKAAIPKDYLSKKHRRTTLEDYFTRAFHQAAEKFTRQARGSGKSGLISTVSPGQEILERTSCRVDKDNGTLYYRLEVGFPANGRTINSGELIKILFNFLPECVKEALFYREAIAEEVRRRIFLSDDQAFIRDEIEKLGLCAFVADGAILPRASGVSALPMRGAQAFVSPDSLRVELSLPHHGKLSGMGIRKGITLIVGGGYHGKSTLLKALELGVYNHIEGDGREYVITDGSAMKIRAEDGRSVHETDISLFIKNLPNRLDTGRFSTEDASGSTSQAANTVEAMESGSGLLLIDEDTCATNFMIRDELMQKVIHRDKEPITPFIERIRPLRELTGLSTILVAGSFGAFFHIADTIIQMDHYVPKDITADAKEAARDYPLKNSTSKDTDIVLPSYARRVQPVQKFNFRDRIKTKTFGRDGFSVEHENVELRYLEQIADGGQSAALCRVLIYAMKHLFDGKRTLSECVDFLMKKLTENAEDVFCESSYVTPGFTMPRRQEIFACIDRCRFLGIRLGRS